MCGETYLEVATTYVSGVTSDKNMLSVKYFSKGEGKIKQK